MPKEENLALFLNLGQSLHQIAAEFQMRLVTAAKTFKYWFTYDMFDI